MLPINHLVIAHPWLALAAFDLGIGSLAWQRFRRGVRPTMRKALVVALVVMGGLVNLSSTFCPPNVMVAAYMLTVPCLVLLLWESREGKQSAGGDSGRRELG